MNIFNRCHGPSGGHRLVGALLGLLLVVAASRSAGAVDLTFAVHPVLPPKETFEVYGPLAEYLTQASGHEVHLVTTSKFLVHWQLMKRGIYHLILDGPHFSDYRVNKMGYTILAKFPGLVSYSLVARKDQQINDPEDFIGRTLATSPSPSMGALRLHEIFRNPMRQPKVMQVHDSVEAAQMAVKGEVDGAIIPTGMLSRFPELVSIMHTPLVPSPAISAGPSVSAEVQTAIEGALLNANNSPEGRKALEAMGVEKFEDTSSIVYEGQRYILEGVWGY